MRGGDGIAAGPGKATAAGEDRREDSARNAHGKIVLPIAGRELCRQAILRHLPEDAPAQYRAALAGPREELRQAIAAQLRELRP